jgi:uncharacterized protein YjbJ (UPF0337 family)
MSLIDKVVGRLKKAAGDVTEDPELRRQGVIDERAGKAKDDLRDSQREVERQAARVAELERQRR